MAGWIIPKYTTENTKIIFHPQNYLAKLSKPYMAFISGQLSEGRVFSAVADYPLTYVEPYCGASRMNDVDEKNSQNKTIPVDQENLIPFLKGVI